MIRATGKITELAAHGIYSLGKQLINFTKQTITYISDELLGMENKLQRGTVPTIEQTKQNMEKLNKIKDLYGEWLESTDRYMNRIALDSKNKEEFLTLKNQKQILASKLIISSQIASRLEETIRNFGGDIEEDISFARELRDQFLELELKWQKINERDGIPSNEWYERYRNLAETPTLLSQLDSPVKNAMIDQLIDFQTDLGISSEARDIRDNYRKAKENFKEFTKTAPRIYPKDKYKYLDEMRRTRQAKMRTEMGKESRREQLDRSRTSKPKNIDEQNVDETDITLWAVPESEDSSIDMGPLVPAEQSLLLAEEPRTILEGDRLGGYTKKRKHKKSNKKRKTHKRKSNKKRKTKRRR